MSCLKGRKHHRYLRDNVVLKWGAREEGTDQCIWCNKTRTQVEEERRKTPLEWVKPHNRRKKGGKRKTVEVVGYWRKKK